MERTRWWHVAPAVLPMAAALLAWNLLVWGVYLWTR